MSLPEPAPSADGLCVVCRGPHKPPAKGLAAMREYESDPFCSSECCRRWYGTQLPVDRSRPTRGYVESKGGDASCSRITRQLPT